MRTRYSLLILATLVNSWCAQAQTVSPREGLHAVPPVIHDERGGGSCDTIDFEIYAEGTVIADQFQSCGIAFEDAITTIYLGTYGSVIHNDPTWYEAITMRFVDPADGSTPNPVSYVSFDNVVDPLISSGEIDYITMKAYDVDGVLLSTIGNASASRVEVITDAPVIASIVVDDSLGTAYVLDNVVVGPGLIQAIAEQASTSWVRAFPDPFQDEVHVRTNLRNSPPGIMDVQGRSLALPAPRREDHGWYMDLRALAPGTYVLYLEDGGRVLTQRIVKQ